MACAPEPDEEQVAPLCHYPVITPCDLCDTKDDVNSFCRNCSQNLCDACKRAHLRCTLTRDNNIVHISEGKTSDSEPAACKIHGERLFFYCRFCSVLFCPKCLKPNHKYHDFLDTDDYAKELQSTITFMIEEKSNQVEASEKNCQYIQESKRKYVDEYTKCKMSVINVAKYIHCEVDKVQDDFLSTINHHESQGLSKFEEAINQENMTGEALQESLNKLVRQSKKHDNISLIAYASQISEDCRVKKDNDEMELETANDIPSIRVPTVDFRESKISKNSILKLYGALRNQYADIPIKCVAESTKKLPESKMDQRESTTNQQHISKLKHSSEESVFCTCQIPLRFHFMPNKCNHCHKIILKK